MGGDGGKKRILNQIDQLQSQLQQLPLDVKELSHLEVDGVGSVELSQLCVEFNAAINAFRNVVDRRVRIGVDSGADLTVWPEGLCDDVPAGTERGQ